MAIHTKDKTYQIKNATLILPTGIYEHYSLIIESGKIAEIRTEKASPINLPTIDAKGLFVAPGFIDTHVHGGGGYDYAEASPEAFHAISKAHAKHGTTAIYPTLAAAPLSVFKQAIKTCETVMNEKTYGAKVLGLHLEGNYLNPIMSGGQNPEYLSIPNEEEYKDLLKNTSCIKRWSAAPELPGALEFGRFATDSGVLVSLAHTVADYDLLKEAWKSGYIHATHFYNAMTSVHKEGEYKKEGTIEAIYLMDEMTVEIIADGIHIPSAIIELVYKQKGVDKTLLVTDAMAAAACDDLSKLKDDRVIIEDGVCKLADRSALAGSIATADRLIRTLVNKAGIPLVETIRMASNTPARVMGIYDNKGSLESGKDADIIIFDKDIQIQTTIVEGEVVYDRNKK